MEPVAGGVCAAEGFRAAGVVAGLRESGRPDLAVVVADRTASAAGVLTRNQVKAAPVILTRKHLGSGSARAVLLNAGSANACTGAQGLALAERAAATTAAAVGCPAKDVLLCSTGVIGVPIPAATYLAGIPAVVEAATRDGATDAAQAIMTTDSRPKEAALRVADGAGAWTVGGMAKGAGMIAPSMATMLAVLTTDAPVDPVAARSALKRAVDESFNRISVDGSMSTNDTVLLLASGSARTVPDPEVLGAALTAVCDDLATQMVRDGEGATRVLHLHVQGAASNEEAMTVARQVGNDLLVKTALFGGDPNWGRVIAAVGASPVRIDPDRITIRFGDVVVCERGVVTRFDQTRAAAVMSKSDVVCTIDLGAGDAHGTFKTSDLTYDYVRINAEYRT